MTAVIVSVVAFCRLEARDGDSGCLEAEAAVYLAAPGSDQGSLEVTQYWGEEAVTLEVTARLRSNLPGDYGVSGWSLSVKHDPDVLEILEATYEGTGGQELCGSVFMETVHNETGAGFVIASMYPCPRLGDPVFPPVGDFSLARATYRVVAPDVPPPSAPQGLTRETTIRFEDGLQGSGEPVTNALMLQGETLLACEESLKLQVEFVETREFIRGDANYDLALDISDPVTVLQAMFHGDVKIRCAAAADANNDGKIDISDGIYVFNYLFLGGNRPPPPFPEMGLDPEPAGLLCRP